MIPALAKISHHVIPIPFLVTGFILAILCLTAGNKAGFMEEYALVRVRFPQPGLQLHGISLTSPQIDMSGLGNNLFTSSNDTSSDEDDEDDKDDDEDKDDDDDDDEDDGGIVDRINPFDRRHAARDIFDDAKDKFDETKDKAKDKIGELGNELVDGLAEDLGVKDWYSLHILTFCQGEFKNGTNNGTEVHKNGVDVDECSKPSADGMYPRTPFHPLLGRLTGHRRKIQPHRSPRHRLSFRRPLRHPHPFGHRAPTPEALQASPRPHLPIRPHYYRRLLRRGFQRPDGRLAQVLLLPVLAIQLHHDWRRGHERHDQQHHHHDRHHHPQRCPGGPRRVDRRPGRPGLAVPGHNVVHVRRRVSGVGILDRGVLDREEGEEGHRDAGIQGGTGGSE